MVIQKTVNNLKEGPKEDKVAVASGIAITVVVVLLIGWAFFFIRNVARNSQNLQIGGGAQDAFNFKNVTEAQQQIQKSLSNPSPDIQSSQSDSSGSGQTKPVQMQLQGQQTDQFGTPGSGY